MRLGEAEGLTYIHAFNDDAIIAGQGTIGLELIEQLPDMEAVVIPVGGGGLMGGIAVAVKAYNPKIRIIGVQTARFASMRAAMKAHEPVTLPPATTIADGIGVRRVGERNLEIAELLMDEYVTVEEEEVASAILMLLEREKTVAEGAGAAGAAALIERKTTLVGRRVACLICGGNIDPIFLTRIVERGLVKDGRLVRLRLQAADYPGVLHAVTGVFAKLRVNVIHIEHERAYFGGTAFGAISTKSISASSAFAKASRKLTMPSGSPSMPTKRTSAAVISPLIRVSLSCAISISPNN